MEFDRDAQEQTSSTAGVKALRARLEQQNREAAGPVSAARPGKITAGPTPVQNGKEHESNERSHIAPAPAVQRSGPPAVVEGSGQESQEVGRWKKEAEEHKNAAKQLAKAAKDAKQEASESKRQLEEERNRAQWCLSQSQEEACAVIDRLQQQVHHLMHQVNSSMNNQHNASMNTDMSSILEEMNDLKQQNDAFLTQLQSKDKEVDGIHRHAEESMQREREKNQAQIKALQDALNHERTRRQEVQKVADQNGGDVLDAQDVLLQAIDNRDLRIADLERQVAHAKILGGVPKLEEELNATRNGLHIKNVEMEKLMGEMHSLYEECERLRAMLPTAGSSGGGGLQYGGLDRVRDENMQELLKLQDDLVLELDLMRRDMQAQAVHNKALQEENIRLADELSVGGQRATVVARSAAPELLPSAPSRAAEKAQEHIAQMQTELVQAHQKADTLEAELKGVEAELKELKKTSAKLRQLEDVNAKFKAKVKELTGLLDDSHAEKIELSRQVQALRSAPPPKNKGPTEEEMERIEKRIEKERIEKRIDQLQGICEKQSKWILPQASNRDHILLFELHAKICACTKEDHDVIALKKLVESQKLQVANQDPKEEMEKLQQRMEQLQVILEINTPLEIHPKQEMEKLKQRMEELQAILGINTEEPDFFFSADPKEEMEKLKQRIYKLQVILGINTLPEDQVTNEDPVTNEEQDWNGTAQKKMKVQRSVGPGMMQETSAFQPSSAPQSDQSSTTTPMLRSSMDPNMRSSQGGTGSLRDSTIDHMLASFPDNRDLYSSGRSVSSSKYSAADVPDIADDILNYRPPSENRKSLFKTHDAKVKSSEGNKHPLKPSEYVQSVASTESERKVVSANVIVNRTQMTPSEYLASRGLQLTPTSRLPPPTPSPSKTSENVRHAPVTSQPISPISSSANNSSADHITDDRLDKFAKYQEMLEQQGPEEWEKGLSNVQLTPDGSIIPVHATHASASKLMPVEEDDSDDEIDDQSVARALLLNPLDVYPPEFGGGANPNAPNVFTSAKPPKPEFGESGGMHM